MRSSARLSSFLKILYVLPAAAAVSLPAATGFPQFSEALRPYAPAEQYVLDQTAVGQIADLKEKFGEDEPARRLRARFVEDLVTGALAEATVTRFGVRIAHGAIEDRLDLKNAVVLCETWLENCEFRGEVVLADSEFRLNLSFEGSVFKKKADFNSMTVSHSVSFYGAVFEDAADFRVSHVGNQFIADGARFANSEKEANFNSLSVGQSAFFRKALFEGAANFQSAKVESQLVATESRFANPGQKAIFNGMAVGAAAFFDNVVFEGAADFRNAQIGKQFLASAARFANPEQEASFSGLTVGQSAFFDNAVFEGSVDFATAQIGSRFIADGARFSNPGKEANFSLMTVKDVARFEKTAFEGPVLMADGSFLSLWLQGPAEAQSPAPLLDLSRTVVGRELRIAEASFAVFIADSLQVKGLSSFRQLAVRDTWVMERSQFSSLILCGLAPPDRPDGFRLDGMTYQIISAGEGNDSLAPLLALLQKAFYSPQIYGELEKFFDRQGYPDLADQAYVAMRKRAESERRVRGAGLAWSKLSGRLVNYGRNPEWAFYWSLPFLFLGCLIFPRRKYMAPQDPRGSPVPFNPFWYSLDLFLPFIDLRVGNAWKPHEQEHPFPRIARFYMHLHVLAGWILIPIALAALGGIMR